MIEPAAFLKFAKRLVEKGFGRVAAALAVELSGTGKSRELKEKTSTAYRNSACCRVRRIIMLSN